jgi:prepilin-type N-terminal cleavage/methylation domain-containing protein
MSCLKKRPKKSAFTLIELLIVLFILALLMGILAPSLQKARRAAIALVSSSNQRMAVTGLSCYAADNDGRFPDSVATLGTGLRWSWREPTVMIGFQKRSPEIHRSVSEYLGGYIDKASAMFCPCAPSKYKFAQQAWAAGDSWDNPNPDTDVEDPLFGNYCLYWNYVGYLEGRDYPFIGPRSAAGPKTQSKLLISDYFGYGHWRNELTHGSRNAYGSCEKMAKARITKGTSVACDFWSLPDLENRIRAESLNLILHAGYVDGHVRKFTPGDTMTMKVSMTPDGKIPYPDNIGPAGTIYIPADRW